MNKLSRATISRALFTETICNSKLIQKTGISHIDYAGMSFGEIKY